MKQKCSKLGLSLLFKNMPNDSSALKPWEKDYLRPLLTHCLSLHIGGMSPINGRDVHFQEVLKESTPPTAAYEFLYLRVLLLYRLQWNEGPAKWRQIFHAYQPYCEGFRQILLGPEGRPPTVVNVEAGESLVDAVERVIHQLVSAGKIPPENIDVLTPTQSSSGLFQPTLANIPTQLSVQIQPGKLVVETIHSFKGQESPVVVLAEMHLAPPDQEARLNYIAMSRAVHERVTIQ